MGKKDKELIQDANVKKQQGDYKESLNLYNGAIELKGEHLYEAYYNKGILLNHLNNTLEAQQCFEMATNLKPDCGIAWFYWGELLCKVHNYSRAKEKFEKAYKTDPSNINPQIGIAYCFNRTNEFPKAIQMLSNLLNAPKDPKQESKICSELGLAFLQTNNLQKAYNNFIRAYELNDQDYQACYNIAFIEDLSKNYEKAISFYENAIALSPNEGKAYQGLACTYIHMKKYQQAKDYINKAIALNPNNFEGYYNLACVYAGLQNQKGTIDALKKRLRLRLSILASKTTF